MAVPAREYQEKRLVLSVDQWWETTNSISVFVAGKTGTGKSTLVNALLGEAVAKDVEMPEVMPEVMPYKGNIQEIDVTVWDSPGLQDGTKNEEKYLNGIKMKYNGEVDLLLYCISMNTTRFVSGSPDIESMINLTKTLGPEIWENAMIILTRANKEIRGMRKKLPDPESVAAKFNERLGEWRSQIVRYLQEDIGLSVGVAQNIQIVPAGRIEIPFLLEGHRPWLSHLWIESLAATKMKAQPALIKMNITRLIKSSDVGSDDDMENIIRKKKTVYSDKDWQDLRELILQDN